jgi:transcriptional pleiotropic regulator of transition state genes
LLVLFREVLPMMKATGIVRQLDPLGRVVLPIELRRSLSISEKDGLEIFVDEDKIILKKYAPGCIFCGSFEKVRYYKDKVVCQSCIEEMNK